MQSKGSIENGDDFQIFNRFNGIDDRFSMFLARGIDVHIPNGGFSGLLNEIDLT